MGHELGAERGRIRPRICAGLPVDVDRLFADLRDASDFPTGPWQYAAAGLLTAGTLQITFSTPDVGALNNSARFYKVQLQ